ncbi:hypothetical protein PSPO01_04904 [Paraphaeosphaeria sporulosa]
MWRSSEAYFSRPQNGKPQAWQRMEDTGQAEANSIQWIYVTGGEIRMKI